jgi:ATP-dependent DNA helicase RecG
MITEDQIRFLLSDMENERVERTISTDDADKFAKAVCAFANDLSNKRLPGYLFIGAFDDGKLPVFVTVLREEMRINYPYEAIRELALNAVMHRNYQTNAPVKFYEYEDRIEIDNPGNLYGKVRPDNFPDETDYRNPIIARAMKGLGYVNRFGRGINTVQEILEENKNGLAKFKFDDITTFKVTVMNADDEAVKAMESGAEMEQKDDTEKITERQRKILELIKKDNSISRDALSKLLEVGDSSVYRDIEKFKKNGILKRIGGDKGGYWQIKIKNTSY